MKIHYPIHCLHTYTFDKINALSYMKYFQSSPILEHQPPTILPPSSKKRGPTSKKLFVNCDIQTFPGRASIVDLECKLPSHSMHGTRSLSLDFTHDKDVDNERVSINLACLYLTGNPLQKVITLLN